jgi:hypothetical protein
MARFHDTWTVEPHGELVTLDDGLMTVEGEITMPLGRFPRRMTIARLERGGTAIWSPIPLEERAMQQVEALGMPSWLIIPNAGHRLDARGWKARYPNLRVLCPPGGREKVEEAIKVDAIADPFDDRRLSFEVVPGMLARESALRWRNTSGGETLIVNDIIGNVQHPHGLGAHVMARLFGFGVNRPQIPFVGRRMYVDDPRALAAAFRRWAESDVRRIVPSHGEVVVDPIDTLLRLANELAPSVAA